MGFWMAAKAHRLELQRCQHCGYYSHPPAFVCPQCLSPEPSFRFEPASGLGKIKTWTIMRDAFLPGFREEVPHVILVVELEEQQGLRMIAGLVDGAGAQLAVDAPVQVVFEDITEEIALPQFKLLVRSKDNP